MSNDHVTQMQASLLTGNNYISTIKNNGLEISNLVNQQMMQSKLKLEENALLLEKKKEILVKDGTIMEQQHYISQLEARNNFLKDVLKVRYPEQEKTIKTLDNQENVSIILCPPSPDANARAQP